MRGFRLLAFASVFIVAFAFAFALSGFAAVAGEVKVGTDARKGLSVATYCFGF